MIVLLCRPVNTDDLATCVRGHAPTLRRRSTLRADRTVPNRSIQKEVGKTGYEVIGGHCVWVEKLKVATNRRAADRDTCTEQKSCSRGDRSFSSLIFTPQHIKTPQHLIIKLHCVQKSACLTQAGVISGQRRHKSVTWLRSEKVLG